jgi:hypothetical protein
MLLLGGLLAGSLSGCAARRLRVAETATAGAPGQPTAASANSGIATGAPTVNPADLIGAELDQVDAELNDADTLDDFSTALPPETATATPTSGSVAVTSTPSAHASTAAPPATTPSGTDPGAQLDQMLLALQSQLNHTDTVPEAASP